MIVLIIFLILFVLLVVGVSVPFSFGAATAVLQGIYDFNPVALLTTSFGKIQSVTLLAIPMFVLIMALVFGLTFHVIGAWLQSLLESGI